MSIDLGLLVNYDSFLYDFIRKKMKMSETIQIIVILAIIQGLLSWWIQARITNSIKHEYDKKLEEFKTYQSRKERAAVVAEFLAEWTHLQGSDTKRLNQLLWELTMYLPSNLVRDLKLLISNKGGVKNSNQIIKSVRDYLNDKTDPIDESDVTFFKHPDNTSMNFILDNKAK